MTPPHIKPRQYAISILAAYDHDRADAYEQHLVKIARHWLQMIDNRDGAQSLIDTILIDFRGARPDGYGAAWDDLKTEFLKWAVAEDWL